MVHRQSLEHSNLSLAEEKQLGQAPATFTGVASNLTVAKSRAMASTAGLAVALAWE